jgi:hypothetical protein
MTGPSLIPVVHVDVDDRIMHEYSGAQALHAALQHCN